MKRSEMAMRVMRREGLLIEERERKERLKGEEEEEEEEEEEDLDEVVLEMRTKKAPIIESEAETAVREVRAVCWDELK